MVNEGTESSVPHKAQLNRHGSDLEIILEGPGPHALLSTAIAIFWNIAVLYAILNVGPEAGPPVKPPVESTDLGVSIFDSHPKIRSPASATFERYFGFIVMFGVGAVLAYYAMGLWINRIHIFLSKDRLAFQQRPLPWNGNLKVSVSDIKQLYTEEIVEDAESGSKSSEIYVITGNGEHKRVIGFKVNGRGISREHAHFVVNEVEDHLNR